MIHHVPHRPPFHDFPVDEWNVIEKGFHPEFLAQLETMLALGNGYLGMRGCPEEGGPNAENATLINGYYETHPIIYVEGAYGFARTGQTILSVEQTKGHLTLRAAADAQPVKEQQVPVLAHVSINFVMKYTCCGQPLKVTVLPAGPAK